MVDTVTAAAAAATVGNDNDDWEVAVDTGEFDKRLAQQEKTRASNQELIIPPALPTITDDDSRNTSSFDIMKSNKPIRILKRPTSQSQLSTNNDVVNPSMATATAISIATTTTATPSSSINNNNANNSNSSSSYNSSSSATVPVVSIIPRNPTKDSTNSSEAIATPVFSSTAPSSQPTKPAIKTYEQRELEYRLARLRIMGEEESSAKDDDDLPTVDVTPLSTDDPIRATSSLTNRQTNKISGFTQPPLQCHSTPGSYASDLYTLNNISSNTGAIHFTPNNNNNNNSSAPNLGTGPFSSPNFPQHYRNTYTGPYSHLLPTPAGLPRYPLAATTTTTTLYMTSTAPFISAPSSSSSSSSYHYPPPQHPHMSTNNWYHYQHPQTPYGTQQYGHPQ